MKFSKEELNKIKQDKIFIKQINNSKYWIKPLFESKSYPLGNIKSHRRYFQALKEYLSKYFPETKFIKFDKKITLIAQKHIEGRKLKTLKEIKELMTLKENKSFGHELRKLFENKSWVIDLYNYKGNFIVTKNKKLFYIDGRMPIFPDPKESRYQISKKRTLQLLRGIDNQI